MAATQFGPQWTEDDIKNCSDAMTHGTQCVENLVYHCDADGLHICCHILSVVAHLQRAFLYRNRKIMQRASEKIALLAEQLYLTILEKDYYRHAG